MTIFLETERLILKNTEQLDFDNLVALRTDPDVMRYVGSGVQTKEEVQRFLDNAIPYHKKHGFGFCSVFEKETGDFIGQAGLFHVGFYDEQPEIEIGYRFYKKYWGKGYGTEVARALVHWGFEHLDIEKLVAFVHPDNIASLRILQKCGMVNLGVVHSYYGDIPKYEIYKSDAIELLPHDSTWAQQAALEIKQLRESLPEQHLLDLQHVGSTAIPGIHAKPIIDIQIAVDSLSAIKAIAIDALQKLDYVYWHENPDPERLFFVKGMPPYGEKRSHHVHIFEPSSKHWQQKIQFRDYLLCHHEAAQEYECIKLQLMKQHTYDREKYTEAKTHFVHDILQKANKEISEKSLPFIVFLTGASGAGKTTIIHSLRNCSSDSYTVHLHFDHIGVPSVDEMNRIYGSGSEWQKAMTYHWIKNIIDDYGNKKLVILEGQVNLDFIISALRGFNIPHYKIILAHCDKVTRHKRLHLDRNQPELVNDTMDSWAEFLKKQAVDKNSIIIDTSEMSKDKMIEAFNNIIASIIR